VKPPAVSGVYPLFPDKPATASSMMRPMDLTIQNSEFLYPGQVSIFGADQPVYAIIKLFQGYFPATVGENKLVAIYMLNYVNYWNYCIINYIKPLIIRFLILKTCVERKTSSISSHGYEVLWPLL
jgi:hypothetical protein